MYYLMMKVIFRGNLKIESGQLVTKYYWYQRESEMKTEEWYWKG